MRARPDQSPSWTHTGIIGWGGPPCQNRPQPTEIQDPAGAGLTVSDHPIPSWETPRLDSGTLRTPKKVIAIELSYKRISSSILLQTHPSRHGDTSGDKFVTGFVTEIKTSAYPLTSAQLVSVLIAYATDSLSTSFQSNLVHYTMFTG